MRKSDYEARDGDASNHAGAIGATTSDAPSDRMFAIIDCVTSNRVPMSVADISDRLGLPSPTVHRITKQLTAMGFLKRALESKRIVPGPRLAEFGVRAAAAAFVADLPHAILTSLSEELEEHCQVGIMSEGKIIYVDAVSPSRATGLKFFPGSTAPLHCSSIGKVYLSQLDERDLQRVISTLPLIRYTETTICDPARLLDEIGQVKRIGWATNNKEFSAGVVGCAVPIFDTQQRLIAGLGASVPDAYVNFKDIARLIPVIKVAAEKISQSLRVRHESV